MTNEEFKESLTFALRKKYPHANIHIVLVQRATYEEEYSRLFHVSAAINFLEPIAVVKVAQRKITEAFLAFIDKRRIGHICPEDKGDTQKRSPIANFETQI